MADQKLRELERRTASGDPDAFNRLIRYVVKTTGIDDGQAAARYYFPHLYKWCLDAIAHKMIYFIIEYFPATNYLPRRSYMKFYTIGPMHDGTPGLVECWPLGDKENPHYEELAEELRFRFVERHPWNRYCFRGTNAEDKMVNIFELFGLDTSALPYLKPLFSVGPEEYPEILEQIEEATCEYCGSPDCDPETGWACDEAMVGGFED